jgi:hypothetical protein
MRVVDDKTKIVVPKQSVATVLTFLHDSPLAGHRDFDKTFDSINSKYFWLNMHKDIKSYCATCHLCQTKKYLNKPNVAPLKPIVVNTPWGLIGLDIAGKFKKTPSGNEYIVIAVDYFTKFCIARAIPDFTALSTAKFIFEEIICKMGMPSSIISDRGVNFQSNLFEQLCKLLKIKKVNATFYHPAGNGMIERMIKSIKQILTMYVDATHTNWDNFLQSSISAYNTSKQASLKMSPYEVLFAREPVKLADVILSKPISLPEKKTSEYVDELKQNALKINNRINENLKRAQEIQKKYYDKTIKNSRKFEIGDLVLVVNERSILGESSAFKNRAIGPYKIVGKFNDDLNYKIMALNNDRVQTIHYNRLLYYKARNPDELSFGVNKPSMKQTKIQT